MTDTDMDEILGLLREMCVVAKATTGLPKTI